MVLDKRTIWYPNFSASQEIYLGLNKQLLDTSRTNTAEYHNAFMEYSLALLFYATGHRPIQDPFCYRHQIDEKSGFMLIDDKVSNELRRFHIAYLSDIAKQQVSNYLKHLKLLSQSSRAIPNEVFRNQLKDMLCFNEKQSIPLFFYIKNGEVVSIEQSHIDILYQRFCNAPANDQRRHLASKLAEKGIPNWLISSVLRHAETGVLPSGDYCRESHIDIRNLLNEPLDQILSESGWEPVESDYRPQYAKMLVISSSKDRIELGPKLREQERFKRKLKARGIVRSIISQQNDSWASDSEGFQIWLDESYQSLVDQLKAEQLPLKDSLRLFQRYVKQIATRSINNRNYLWSREFKTETSLWRDSDLLLYRKASNARNKFFILLEELARKDLSPKEIESQLRILLPVSLALNSGINKNEDLVDILNGNFSLHQFESTFILQIGSKQFLEDQSPIHIDPVSAGIAIRLDHRAYRGSPPVKAIRALINDLYLDVIALSTNEYFQPLLPYANALHKVESGGIKRAYKIGRQKSTNLDARVLSRIQSGNPLVREAMDPIRPFLLYEHSLKRYQSDNKALKDLNDWKSNLHDVMTDENIQSYITLQKEKKPKLVFEHNHLSKSQKRDYLSGEMRRLLKTSSLPMLGQLIAHWGIYLCENKTRHNNIVDANTIINYVSLVCRQLVGIAHESPLYFEASEWEDAYLLAIEGSSISAMQNLAARLFDFHHYLTIYWRIPRLDWGPVFGLAGLKDQSGQVDANLITPFEYRRLMDFFCSDLDEKSTEDLFSAWMIFLGYRFGLRWSEAFFIRKQDVVSNGYDLSHIRIKATVFRDLKTEASRRTVPLIENITADEQLLVRRMLSLHDNVLNSINPIGHLFCVDPFTHERLDEVKLSLNINDLLRQVSGDQRVHYHHFRHGFACRMWCHFNHKIIHPSIEGVFATETVKDSAILRNDTFSGVLPQRAISDLLGHASMSTTLHSYIHLLTWTQNPLIGVNNLSNHVLAFLLNKKEPTVRKHRQRNQHWDTEEWLSRSLLNDLESMPVSCDEKSSLFMDRQKCMTDQGIHLRVIHAAFVNYATQGRSLEHTAKKLSIPQRMIEPWLLAGIEAERQSGFERFHLNPLIEESTLQEFESLPEWRRVDDALKLVETLPGLLKSIANVTRYWQGAFHSGSNEFFFMNYDEVSTFVNFLNEIGVVIESGGYWQQGIIEHNAEVIASLENIGLYKLSGTSGYRRQAKGRMYRQQAIVLKIQRLSGTLVRKRQINRLMFLLFSYVHIENE